VLAANRFGRRVGAGLLLCASLVCLSCAVRVIPVDAARQPRPASGGALEVVPSASSEADPVRVGGTNTAFGGVAVAAARWVSAAAAPWAQRHAVERPGGWQMLLEVVRAEAEARDGRITIEIEGRVTVRATVGQVHIGQARCYCKESGDLSGGDGSPVVSRCLERMSRDLVGWLEGLNP
jgi:hypothetical protein